MTGLELCIIVKAALAGMISPYQQKVACQNANYIVQQSEKRGINPLIVTAVIYRESSFSPRVVSHANACGLMQVLPRYSRYTCEQLKNPKIGIRDGIRALKWWLSWAEGTKQERGEKGDTRSATQAALCGYNAGTRCITQPNGRLSKAVTRGYVKRVMNTFHKFRRTQNDKPN